LAGRKPNAPQRSVLHPEKQTQVKEQEYAASTPIPIGIGDASQERALWRALRFDAGPAPRM